MHILVVGLNHRTAPVHIREKLAFPESELGRAHVELRQQKSIFENVIVSTCNRTEIYVVTDQVHTGRYYTKQFLINWFNERPEDIEPYLFVKEGREAVEHLFRLTCGLESLVIGETQILGQVRSSFMLAQSSETTGTFFNELFKQALTVAKRAHSETSINENAVSVSYAAVELANKIFGRLDDKEILIIGAGKMGELTAKHLKSHGVPKIRVVNRTYEKAEELAAHFSGQPLEWTRMESALKETDIVISSTGAKGLVLDAGTVQQAMKERKGRPLFIVDIAVPRDIDPEINKVEGVFLYDIDDLEGIVEANILERQEEAQKIEALIVSQIAAFEQWIKTLGVVPAIQAIREKALMIQEDTMKSLERKLDHLSDRDKKLIGKHMKSIINQLLRDPIQRAKEFADEREGQLKLETLIQLFGVEEAYEKKVAGTASNLAESKQPNAEGQKVRWNEAAINS
ncbi:glutamyl-tRNA reductase [Pullulanibacillus sp. KACC 23026]|uniref:glutamyl-tRNA reductase n=1 Tax=Pullulanibacillus sp. KACC 23026 TaxID=3028315 RepID=UPI0023AFD089|nr:glutamyl-tRNA reductase [Pullulanibacillus sp. KACC 23026]WEG14036.1 glutamyl-tRNA reductase [Pullulanibacillus sp. KACC 23026]